MRVDPVVNMRLIEIDSRAFPRMGPFDRSTPHRHVNMRFFVQRRRDPKDGRNVFVERTQKGDEFLALLGETILHGDAATLVRPVLELAS